MSTWGDETITVRAELDGGAEGFLVIDSSVRERSSGGLRVAEDLTLEEVAALAREMTLKFAFIGREAGGAKSGIRLPPGADAEAKRRVLVEFGYRLGPIIRRGLYSPGTDMNCSGEDLRAVYAAAGVPLGRLTDTASFTAMAAFDALEACRASLGPTTRPLRIGIEGFGAVAASLAGRLRPEHYRITAVSTALGAALDERGFDAAALVGERGRHGDRLVERLGVRHGPCESLFSADLDVFVPSARTWSLTAERARALRARLVVPLANAPYGAGALAALEAKGAVCLPGYVVNCGGVFASSLYDSGVPLPSVQGVSRHRFRAVVTALLDVHAARGVSPAALAEEVALERLRRRRRALRPESRSRRLARALASELLPRALVGRRYLGRFTRNLVELEALIRQPAAERGWGEAAPRLRLGAVGRLAGDESGEARPWT